MLLLCDFIQGIIMIAGVILMIGYVISAPEVGGLSEGVSKLMLLIPPNKSVAVIKGLFGLIILTVLVFGDCHR